MRYSKYLLCCCCFIILSETISAQDWAPLGAEWRRANDPTGLSGFSYSLLRVEKDTIVAGQECRKYVVYDQPPGQDVNVYQGEGFTFSRNDSVFWWQRDTFLLLYDFSAAVGDTVTVYGWDSYTEEWKVSTSVIDYIGLAPVGIFSDLLNYYNTRFISGDFSAYGEGYYELVGKIPFWRNTAYSGPIAGGPDNYFRCYRDENYEIIFTGTECGFPTPTRNILPAESLHLYPIPAVDNLNIGLQNNYTNARISCLDAKGQVVLEQLLPRGVKETEIDLTGLSVGQYYLYLQSDEGVGVWPFAKM